MFINYLKIVFEVIFEFRRIKCFKAFFWCKNKTKKNNALDVAEPGWIMVLDGIWLVQQRRPLERHVICEDDSKPFCYPFFFNISQLLIYKFYLYYSIHIIKYDLVFCGFYQGIFMRFYAHKVIIWNFLLQNYCNCFRKANIKKYNYAWYNDKSRSLLLVSLPNFIKIILLMKYIFFYLAYVHFSFNLWKKIII